MRAPLLIRQLTHFEIHRMPMTDHRRRAVAVYLTHWFFFSNNSYAGEKKYYVRIGSWRKNFGKPRAEVTL